jgi:VanZ family protein
MMMALPWRLPLLKTENKQTNTFNPSLLWGICLLAWCSLIFWLSDQPTLPTPDIFSGQDKLIHAVVYAFMAWLFWFTWKAKLAGNLSMLAVLAVVFRSAYGASDEWHQSFVQGRDASVYDWLADTSGAFLLILLLETVFAVDQVIGRGSEGG